MIAEYKQVFQWRWAIFCVVHWMCMMTEFQKSYELGSYRGLYEGYLCAQFKFTNSIIISFVFVSIKGSSWFDIINLLKPQKCLNLRRRK